MRRMFQAAYGNRSTSYPQVFSATASYPMTERDHSHRSSGGIKCDDVYISTQWFFYSQGSASKIDTMVEIT